jgi:hypothetical protein
VPRRRMAQRRYLAEEPARVRSAAVKPDTASLKVSVSAMGDTLVSGTSTLIDVTPTPVVKIAASITIVGKVVSNRKVAVSDAVLSLRARSVQAATGTVTVT